MDIKYSNAAPLRTSRCLAWLIEWRAGGVDILLTADTMTVEEVVRMMSVHSHDEFRVSTITVGMLPIDPRWRDPVTSQEIPEHLRDLYTIYSNDGRKVDQDGMVQL